MTTKFIIIFLKYNEIINIIAFLNFDKDKYLRMTLIQVPLKERRSILKILYNF